MGQHDWYRRITWSKFDEEEFYAKLKRTQKFNRVQYLNIQAIILIDTGDDKFLDVAEALLNKALTDLPDEKSFINDTLYYLGKIALRRNDSEKALEFYRTALDTERNHQLIISTVYLDFSELVITLQRTEDYVYTESLLLKNTIPTPPFKEIRQRLYSLIVQISRLNGKEEQADKYANLAEQSGT